MFEMSASIFLWRLFDPYQLVWHQIFEHRTMRGGARFSKVPKSLQARKAIRNTLTLLFCKAGLFGWCNRNKN